jgi:hypothetical protein
VFGIIGHRDEVIGMILGRLDWMASLLSISSDCSASYYL